MNFIALHWVRKHVFPVLHHLYQRLCVCLIMVLLLAFGQALLAEGKPGENWYPDNGQGPNILKAEGEKAKTVADVTTDRGPDGAMTAWKISFKKADEYFVLSNIKQPKVIKPESRDRKFVMWYWIKTSTDYKTGDYSSCWIRMQTPGSIGALVDFPRTRFAYLDKWTQVGQEFTLRPDGLIGSIQFRLIATRPGLDVWIDKVFFTEVTGMPKEKVAELLGGATFKPIMQMPFKEEFVDKSPPVKGNLLWNSGFEFVSDAGWGGTARRLTEKDFARDNPHSGQQALILDNATATHIPVKLTLYKKHSFSFYARKLAPAKPGQVDVCVASYGKNFSYKFTKRVNIEKDWQRVVLTEVLMPVPSLSYYVTITGKNVVIDDTQFEEGDPTPYEPRKGIEAALTMDPGVEAYLYDWGQSPVLNACFANPGKEKITATAQVRVWDIYEKIVSQESIPVTLDPGQRIVKTVTLPDTLRGAFCADLVIDGTIFAERVFGVVPVPRDIPAEKSIMGDHLDFNDFNMKSARRLGTRWTRTHDGWAKITKWYLLEPKQGNWKWNTPYIASVGLDDAVKMSEKYGIKILGLLDEPPGWGVGLPKQERCRDYYPTDWTAWNNYVTQIVSRYKGRIDTWELFNEPSNADKYIELCRNTSAIFKKIYPEGKMIGLSCTPGAPIMKKLLQANGQQYVDGISTHIYSYSPNGNLGANFRSVDDAFKKNGKPMQQWMTEGNPGSAGQMEFFRSHPLYNNERQDVTDMPRYMTVALSNNVKVFYYFNGFPSPSPQDIMTGPTWTYYNHDTSIAPGGVARAVWAKMLDGTEPVGILVDRDEEVYLFRDGAEIVAVVWAETPRNVILPAKCFGPQATCVRYDAMGNTLNVPLTAEHKVALGHFLYYYRFSQATPQEVSTYFRKGLGLPANTQIRKDGTLIREEDAFKASSLQ